MATLSDPFLAKWDPQLLETKAFQGSKTRERFKTGPKTGPGGSIFGGRSGPGPGRAPAKIARLGSGNVRFGPRWGVNTTQNAFSVPGNTNNVGTDRFGEHFFPSSKSAFFDPQNRPKTRFW